MRIEKSLLTGLGVSGDRAEKYLSAMNEALAEHGIDTPLRVAHFLSQVLHESGKMKFVEENLNYSADGLSKIFGKYFKTTAEAEAYARNREKIGSRVYGNRMGNGPEATGEGYRYRGRGLIQLTGKNNYQAFSDWINDDVVADPDRVANQYVVHSAVFFWTKNNINALADKDDVVRVTKRINGGTHGLDDRKAILAKAKALLNIEAAPPPPSLLKQITHRVNASSLRVRSTAGTASDNVITSLSRGAAVEVVPGSEVMAGGLEWVKIRFEDNGQIKEGFTASKFLHAGG